MMTLKNVLLFILILAILGVSGCQQEAGISTLSAALSELSGTVDTKLAGQEDFIPASADTILDVNGQVQTGNDGRVRLDLSSGTIIRVGPSSFFTLTANDEVEGGLATRIRLEVGKIFIILNGGSADVETPSGVASVRGSYMKVEVDPVTFDIYITCLEGDCSASNPAGTVNFTNGEKVILFHRDPVTGNWTAPNVEPMTPEEFQEWLDNNPEARELFDQAMATMTAMAQPTET
ncbi:MAG TPA: FecR domain-containing protein, partial [Anaerolineales bacterium]|nr:FecR domain-containing protein [Anaerolineales bacterium]